MKKLAILFVVACAALVGCKSVPTVDKISSVARAVGYSTGLVANECKIDDTSRNAICEIAGLVREVVPGTNETFVVVWTTIAQCYVNDLVAKEKLTPEQSVLVMGGFKLVASGVDYIFIKYPKASEYKDLTSAAIRSYVDSFLTVFKPVNLNKRGYAEHVLNYASAEYDRDAYIFLKERCK